MTKQLDPRYQETKSKRKEIVISGYLERNPDRKITKSELQIELEAQGWKLLTNHPVSRSGSLLSMISFDDLVKLQKARGLQVRTEPAYDIYGRGPVKEMKAIYTRENAEEDKQ